VLMVIEKVGLEVRCSFSKKLSRCWVIATCELLIFAANCKTRHFPKPHCRLFLSRISASQDITIWVGFGLQVAKTPIYPVLCRFPLCLYCTIWSQSNNVTDRQTDGRRTNMACRAKTNTERSFYLLTLTNTWNYTILDLGLMQFWRRSRMHCTLT